jgi:hypothetical protein
MKKNGMKIREPMNGGEEKWYTLQKSLFTLVILPLG